MCVNNKSKSDGTYTLYTVELFIIELSKVCISVNIKVKLLMWTRSCLSYKTNFQF